MLLHPACPVLDVATADGVTVVHFNERNLGEPRIHAIGEELTRLADAARGQRIFLDFADVEYVSSLALGQVISLHRKVKLAGGQLTLVNLRPFVYEVFQVTHLTSVLDVRPRDQESGAA